MIRRPAVFFLLILSAAAQTAPEKAEAPLQNQGKPMRLPYECTAADSQSAGLSCSEDEPCPVYLELANVEAVGNRLFLTGNLHTHNATLYSVLLGSEDSGATWTEPQARILSSGLDQIQFFDFQNGWISGANLQSAPRDPFFLISTDGGKTWRKRDIFDESRVVAVERFWFTSPKEGMMLIDARLDNNRRELYETRTGGESWALRQASLTPIHFPLNPDTSHSGWRLRADAATHSYAVEKSQSEHWQKVASFLVDAGACKQ